MIVLPLQYQRERESAVAASESAYEASHMLQDQLSLVTRERDMAQRKVKELKVNALCSI